MLAALSFTAKVAKGTAKNAKVRSANVFLLLPTLD
jgi:hypothetical protein